jgi:hypothetical protein
MLSSMQGGPYILHNSDGVTMDKTGKATNFQIEPSGNCFTKCNTARCEIPAFITNFTSKDKPRNEPHYCVYSP